MSNVFVIRNEGSKIQKKHGFHYLSNKEFSELQKEDNEIKVVGASKLKVIKSEKRNEVDTYLMFNPKDNPTVYFKISKPRTSLFKKGYICVGHKKYVSYSRLSLSLIIILLLAVMLVCLFFGHNGKGKLELDDFKPIDLTEDSPSVQTKTYDFQTQGSYSISKDKPTIKVWNPESNTRIFMYKVYVDEELISETKGITPGNMVEVDCSSLLKKKGEHKLVLELSVVDENTGKLVGQAQRNAVLTVN